MRLHNHDCNSCIYLGSDSEADYYYHLDDTLIARYGEDGDYSSGFTFVMSNIGLNEALKRASEQNVLSEKIKSEIKNEQRRWFKYYEEDKEYAVGIAERWKNKTRFILK